LIAHFLLVYMYIGVVMYCLFVAMQLPVWDPGLL